MRKLIIQFILFPAISITQAQELPPIQLDRPDQTECPFTVPQKYIQAEIGFNYENLSNSSYSLLIPTALIKYGITDRLEFRLITELEKLKITTGSATGLNPVKVGFKTKLVKENGWIPMISFIGHLALAPVAGKHQKADYYAPSFRFTLQHTLSPSFSLGYNLGAEWDGFSPETNFLYTLTTGYAISGKTGCYLEIFGTMPENSRASHNIDGGFTLLVNNNMMLDISGGTGLSSHTPGYYISAGFSFRLK